MNTLNYIKKKFKLRYKVKMPIVLPFTRLKGLPKLFRELGFKVGAEIGVSRGFYSKTLFLGIPRLKLYLIDPWETYGEYVEHHKPENQPILDANLTKTKERLAPYNCEYIRKYSMDAVKDFADESLDFVFIDGNHSARYVIDDIDEWSKKVKKGGIISGHDYWNSIDIRHPWAETINKKEKRLLCQVKDSVDMWTKTNGIKPWFVTSGEKCNSWLWIKQ
jgi:predicted O-methyltransferase YrrM